MQATLDKFGRVVIPKEIRDDLDLEAGDALQIEKEDERIVLRPIRGEPHIVDKEGVLVFTGSATRDIVSVVEKQRRKRIGAVGRRGWK